MFVLAVVPAMFVASSIGEEIEDRTITYLWSRPLPRWHVIAGKLVALAPVAIGHLAPRLAGRRCKVGTDAPSRRDGRSSASPLPRVAISMVAAGIATLAPKHGMALAIIYMLLFDVPVGEIPASLQTCRSRTRRA